MKHALLALLMFPALATAQGLCMIETAGYVTDQRLAECHPKMTDKCAYVLSGSGKTVGATTEDVEDAKMGGQKLMDFMSKQTCESGDKCGFYVSQFAMTATCDGKAVQDMPGGEYRGLTSAKARQSQNQANNIAEKVAEQGKIRGDKAKGKGKGKIWGAKD